MLEKEIAKELTLQAIKGLDIKIGSTKTAAERNDFLGKEVGKLYKEIFKSVVEASEEFNK